MRVLPHIKRLDGLMIALATSTCEWFVSAAPARDPAAVTCSPGRLEGSARGARAADAVLEVREEGCGGGRGRETEAARIAEESALTSPHHPLREGRAGVMPRNLGDNSAQYGVGLPYVRWSPFGTVIGDIR